LSERCRQPARPALGAAVDQFRDRWFGNSGGCGTRSAALGVRGEISSVRATAKRLCPAVQRSAASLIRRRSSRKGGRAWRSFARGARRMTREPWRIPSGAWRGKTWSLVERLGLRWLQLCGETHLGLHRETHERAGERSPRSGDLTHGTARARSPVGPRILALYDGSPGSRGNHVGHRTHFDELRVPGRA